MKHKGTITIETDRLILRKFTDDDVDTAFRNWTSDAKVTEFLRWPTHTDISVTKRVLNGWIADYERPEFYQWAIVLEVSGGIPVTQAKPLQQLFHSFLSRWKPSELSPSMTRRILTPAE